MLSISSAFAEDKTAFDVTNGIITDDLAAPTNIQSDAVAFKKVLVTWEPAFGASSYELFRSYGIDNLYYYEKIAEIDDPTITTYCDTDFNKIGKRYHYAIRSVYPLSDTEFLYSECTRDEAGSSPAVGTANFTEHRTLVKKNNEKKLAGIKLSWNKVSNADGYIISYADESKDGKWKKLVVVNDKLTYTVKTTKLKKGHIYKFRIKAYTTINGKKYYGGYSYDSNDEDTILYVPPLSIAAPKNVRIVDENDGKYLKWNPVKGARRYQIYVRNSEKDNWKAIDTTSGTKIHLTYLVDSNRPIYFAVSSGKHHDGGMWIYSTKKSKAVGYNIGTDRVINFQSPLVETIVRDSFNIPSGEILEYQIMDNETLLWKKYISMFPLGYSSEEFDAVISDLKTFKASFYHYDVSVNMDNQESIDQFKAIYMKISEVVENVKMLKTDYDKAKAIHDYLVNNMYYNYDIMHNGSTKPHLYDALVLGSGVCHDYAEAFKQLCLESGLECYYVSSSTHAWNVVNIDGKYYNVDCTWDDPSNRLRYDYFLISDEEIERIGAPHHKRSNYSRDNFPECPENYIS